MQLDQLTEQITRERIQIPSETPTEEAMIIINLQKMLDLTAQVIYKKYGNTEEYSSLMMQISGLANIIRTKSEEKARESFKRTYGLSE